METFQGVAIFNIKMAEIHFYSILEKFNQLIFDVQVHLTLLHQCWDKLNFEVVVEVTRKFY